MEPWEEITEKRTTKIGMNLESNYSDANTLHRTRGNLLNLTDYGNHFGAGKSF